ncbi:MAG: peptidylprolyl isomerase [Thermoanaerobacteraceae bacterium]|nr:peptidylprolyl isomerase [Thermoanaerobacteraceae bacterium]
MRKKIILLLMVFVMVVGTAACSNQPQDKVVATVNGEDIKKSDFDKTVENYKKSYEAQPNVDEKYWETESQGKKMIDILKENVLDEMIYETILNQQAKKNDINVSSKEFQDELKSHIDSVKTAFGGDEKFKEYLKSQNVSEEFYTNLMKVQLLQYKLWEKATADVKVTDEEVRQYFNQHQTDYKTQPDTVKAAHILIKDKAKADEVLNKAKAGEDFAALAKQYSEDEATKDDGGNLGEFTYYEQPEEISIAAFALEPGDISSLIKASDGYHIIKVFDKKINPVKPFDEVKDEINSMVLSNKRDEKFSQLVDEWKTGAEIKKYPENM